VKSAKVLYMDMFTGDQLRELLKKIFLLSPALMDIKRFADHVILDVNHRFTRFTGYAREDIVGRSMKNLNIFRTEVYENICLLLQKKGAIYNEEVEYRTKIGNLRIGIYSAELINARGEQLVIGILHDITARRQDLDTIKKKDAELKQYSAELEEAKTALQVILKRQLEDQKSLKVRLQNNINELVLPYVTKLDNCILDEIGKGYLNLLKSNLQEIFSPFLSTIVADLKDLTPAEIQVAVMVRNGMKSKNIAELLNISVGTVDTHRNSIRKKLGLKNDKTNLRSYLMSLY